MLQEEGVDQGVVRSRGGALRLRAGGALLLMGLLAGCADAPGLSSYAMAPAKPPEKAAEKAPITRDPSFRINALKGGLTKPELDAIYGVRLVRADGDPTFNLYQVESANAQLGGEREQLALWVIDGKLATWGIVSASGPLAPAEPPPDVPPPEPSSADATGKFGVQIAERRSVAEARAAVEQLRGRYAGLLARQWATIYRVRLPEGVIYRAVVGPFASERRASELCSSLRAAGAQCTIQGG
jgi:hypothetical protein